MQTPHTRVHQAARRFLEPTQDLLVLGIGLSLFGLMLRTLRELFSSAVDFRVVIAEVLFGRARPVGVAVSLHARGWCSSDPRA